MPITADYYAALLFLLLERIHEYEELFGPYLATVPMSTDEYELRLMLPDYQTLSTQESPKPAFIFNIGDIIFICRRDMTTRCLEVFKKEHIRSTLDVILQDAYSEQCTLPTDK